LNQEELTELEEAESLAAAKDAETKMIERLRSQMGNGGLNLAEDPLAAPEWEI
jgi:hypothetical protein